MPPKKKAQKMALSDFFAETTGNSNWADEMESLPTAPARREETGPRRGEPGYLDSMPDRSARTFSGAPQQRDDVPLPDVPPFTAFVGNLTYETEEDEVRGFFEDLSPVSVRLVKDPATGKPKGFGYVEFPSKDNLAAALDRSNANLGGRSVRINVAEASPSRPGRDYAPSVADSADQWRRATPLPAREQAPAPRRTFSGAGAPGAGADAGPERDWSAARGAKFTPSRESSGHGRSREDRPPREERVHEPTAADEADQWRSARPLAAPAATPAGRPGRGDREAPPHRPAGPADTESTWSRGTRAPTGPPAPQEPAGRQRLNLLPRTGAAAAAEAKKESSASPFGAARPIDSAAREREAEQHLEERRGAAAAAATAKKEEAAARKEKEAAAKEAAAKEAAQRRPVRVHPSRLPPKEEPQADADGFETVGAARRGAGASEEKQAASAPVRAAPAKAGFSFAAAAGALGDDSDEVADKLAKTQV